MNRISSSFQLTRRDSIDKRLKKLVDSKIQLTKEELDFVATKFINKESLITHDLIWILLLQSSRIFHLKDFLLKGIEENIHKHYEDFKNRDINFFISRWAFTYLIYLFPEKQKEYFEKHYHQSTNYCFKMSIAACIFKIDQEKGLRLMIDILPNVDYDHETRDTIGQYIYYEGDKYTIKYLEEKIKNESDETMKKVYSEMIEGIQRNEQT